MNRRDFLGRAAWGSAAFTALASGASTKPNCTFPADSQGRIAVASYPFRKDIDPHQGGRMTLLEFPKMVVDGFGVHGIEPLDEHFASTEPGYLADFRGALQAQHCHVVNIPVGRLHGSFYDPDETKRKTAIDSAKKWVDVAVALGSPGIRVHIQGVRGVTPDATRAADSLREVAAYGQSRNIVINLENDDPESEDAPFIVSTIDQAKTPWLRALPDFCNSMLLNKGEDYDYHWMDALFQRACTISHVKEIETDHGQVYKVDAKQTFALAKKNNYRGFFSMEWDSDGDPYAGTKHLIDVTLQALV